MKKNAQLHILLTTSMLKQLKSDAEEAGISLGEYCRGKLKKRSQLDRIEHKLDKVLKKRTAPKQHNS